MKALLPLLLRSCAACAGVSCGSGVAMASLAQETRAPEGLPRDVRAFVARHEACEHFLGEEPYDAARARELARNVKSLCTGSDAKLARLKRKYAGHAAIMDVLLRLDPDLE